MSTKIHNGLKIQADSLDEAIEIINSGKPAIVKSYTDMAVKKEFFLSVNIMVNYLVDQSEILKKNFKIDTPARVSEVDEKSSPMSIAYMEILDSVQNEPEISMVIYPGKVEIGNKNYYLMNIYGDNIIEKKMLAIYEGNISEYAYWDNTDEPDYVTEQEWEMRRTHWEKVLLSKSATPSIEGLTINFVANNKPTAYLSSEERLENLEKMCNMYKERPYQSFSVDHKKVEMMVQILNDSTPGSSTYALMEKVRNKDFTSKELLQYEKLEKIINQKVPEELTPEIMRTKLIDLKKNLNSKAINDKLNDELGQKNKTKPPKV